MGNSTSFTLLFCCKSLHQRQQWLWAKLPFRPTAMVITVLLSQGLKDSEYSLKDGLEALARARTKGVLKVIFNMEKQ